MRLVWYCKLRGQVVPDNIAEDRCRIRVCQYLETRIMSPDGKVVEIT